jgi:D-3-phosphoglycerate dehydrogenase
MGMQVYRNQISGYMPAQFPTLEKEALEALDGITYCQNVEEIDRDLILISNTDTDFTKLPENILNNLKLIIHPNSGYDNFPVDFVKKAPFPIVLGNPIRAHAVANTILSALFNFYSPLEGQQKWKKDRSWNRLLLSEAKILIMGRGHIGRIVEAAIKPLVKELFIYDPALGLDSLPDQKVNTLLLCQGLNRQSNKFINKNFLQEYLEDDFVLINTARGKLVVLDDLIKHMEGLPNSRAFLDVFPEEPFSMESLKNNPQFILNSHQAGVYKNISIKIIEFEKYVIKNFLTDSDVFKMKFDQLILKNKIVNGELI